MEEEKPHIGVGLYGKEDELKQLRDFLNSPHCHLQFREEEKRYYLVSSRFSSIANYEQTLESAKKLLTVIRAFAKMEKGWDFQSITVGRGKTIIEHNKPIAIVDEGKRSRNVALMLSTIDAGTASANPVTVSINGEVRTLTEQSLEREKRLSDDCLDPCEEMENEIYDVLSDFALVTSWSSLQRVLRAIEIDMGKDVEKMGWTEKGKRVSFYWSATHYDAVAESKDELGLDKGRHPKIEFEKMEEKRLEAIQKGKNERSYPPVMHLSEAQSFIGSVLSSWLWKKRQASR